MQSERGEEGFVRGNYLHRPLRPPENRVPLLEGGTNFTARDPQRILEGERKKRLQLSLDLKALERNQDRYNVSC